jgi:hypothetical protein
MARKGASRNAITGEFEPEPAARNIFYDAFHDTGSFDPRMHDPDFLAGKQAVPQRRIAVTITLWGDNVKALDRLSAAMGMNRGRVLDKFIGQAIELLDAREKKDGKGKDDGAVDG